MTGEIELKLGAAASAADKVARLPWLRELSGRVERRRLQSVYFDTRKLELHERGVTLRVRHADRQRLQTIKTMANGTGGSFERGEWEHELSSDAPDLRLAKRTPISPLARKKKLRRKLEPIFETVV